MADTIEYIESNREYVDYESRDDVSFSTALYGAECIDCGRGLQWMLSDPDPDGPKWSAECCGNHYGMSVRSVEVTISDADL